MGADGESTEDGELSMFCTWKRRIAKEMRAAAENKEVKEAAEHSIKMKEAVEKVAEGDIEQTVKSVTVNNLVIGEGLPKVCIPVSALAKEELQDTVRVAAAAEPDILEWRLDRADTTKGIKNLTEIVAAGMEVIRAATAEAGKPGLPVILTLRTRDEGGMADLNRRDYYTVIRDIIEECGLMPDELRPDMIDIEAFDQDSENGFDKVEFLTGMAQENDMKVILSNHDMDKTLPMDEIIKRLKIMDNLGADIPKVAYMPQSGEDVHAIIEGALHAGEIIRKPFIAISMGELGKPSRICSGSQGSAITFAVAKSDEAGSASGQMDAAAMRRYIREYYGV